MGDRDSAFIDVVDAFRAHLTSSRGTNAFADTVLDSLDTVDMTPRPTPAPEQARAPPCDVADLIGMIPNGPLDQIAGALTSVLPHLVWHRCDWYPLPQVGERFAAHHAYASITGPDAPLHADDASIGIFVIAPGVLYRDHRHVAPELYLNLTGPTGWRFDGGLWHDLEAGTAVWNTPNRVHATRTYASPWLTLYAWTQDLYEACDIVQADDWGEVESLLEQTGPRPA